MASLTGVQLHHQFKEAGMHTLPVISMKHSVKLKEYYYQDLEAMPQVLRDSWLADQCGSFENDVKAFLDDKETFVEELYKKLKKITKRWASWNHRSFGTVTSREQIKELISWEQSQAAKTIGPHHQKVYSQMDSESSSIKNPLEKFETSCKESKKLLKSFRKNIYRPLCDFFTSENLESPIRDVHQKLEKCLHKWETLVDSSHINEKLFSKESEKAIFKNSLKNRTYEFDTILRFVPDLSEKQVEVLRLARRWRLMVTSTNNGRRGTFTLTDNTDKLLGKRKELLPLRISKEHSGEEQLPENTRPSFCERGKILKDQSVESRKISRDENIEGRKISRDQSIEGRKISQELLRPVRTSRDHSVLGNKNRSYENLEHEYKKTHEKYTDVLIELNDTKIKYSAYEEKLDEYQKECLSLKRELKYAKESCKILEEKLTDSQRLDSVSSIDDVSASQGYLTVLRKELDNAKMKYCSQRIKLMNAKKRVQLLNTQLVESQQHQQKLQKELHNSRNKCSKLQEQLEISRKNLNTQGSMIDALQHQCYTLKQELDESNATKGELFNRLETAEERCRTMESQLDLTLQRCKTLEHDLRESKSREEGLERENTCLQALCTAKDKAGSPVKKNSCVLPDINKGRSS